MIYQCSFLIMFSFVLCFLGGDEWKLVAEKLGMTPQEIRYLDKRVLNPADAMIGHIANLYVITVEDLYDLLVHCELPVMADIL